MIEAKSIGKKYGGFTALTCIDLKIGPGEIVSIVGPNGAGKSTFVNVLTGLVQPSNGSVFYDGADISSISPQSLAKMGLARSFQLVATFPTLTVKESIALGALARRGLEFKAFGAYYADDQVRLDVEHIARVLGLHNRLDVVCADLSQGEKKLVDIASAFALKPKFVLMDEPTSGVSSADKHEIMKLLIDAARKQGVQSIVLVEHDMDLVSQYSTRVVALKLGSVIADMPPTEFFADPTLLETIVGRVSHA